MCDSCAVHVQCDLAWLGLPSHHPGHTLLLEANGLQVTVQQLLGAAADIKAAAHTPRVHCDFSCARVWQPTCMGPDMAALIQLFQTKLGLH
jgi:hypothetical protein